MEFFVAFSGVADPDLNLQKKVDPVEVGPLEFRICLSVCLFVIQFVDVSRPIHDISKANSILVIKNKKKFIIYDLPFMSYVQND